MKLIMTEYFQGVGVSGQLLPQMTQVHVLEPSKQYEVDDALGIWLLSNRKAIKIMEDKPVSGLPVYDEHGNKTVVKVAPPWEEPALQPDVKPEIPVVNTTRLETPKRARRAK